MVLNIETDKVIDIGDVVLDNMIDVGEVEVETNSVKDLGQVKTNNVMDNSKGLVPGLVSATQERPLSLKAAARFLENPTTWFSDNKVLHYKYCFKNRAESFLKLVYRDFKFQVCCSHQALNKNCSLF